MKIFAVSAIIAGALISGIIINWFVRKKPETELKIQGILMIVLFSFFIYSLVLVINQSTPLFTKHHMANECFVIAFALLILIGFINIRRLNKH